MGIMKFSVTNFIWMVIIALGAFGLYLVKYSVQEVQRDVAALEARLAQEKETIQLLRTEWAYLNRPERLRELANGRVDAQPLTSAHIIDITHIPTRELSLADKESGGVHTIMHQVSGGALYVPTAAR
jgi:hypothetical protein